MTLEPLLDAPPAVRLHVATIVPAVVIGAWLILLSRKGARWHRVLGGLYLGLMTATSIAALFIHEINPDGPGGLSPVHLFVPLTLAGIGGALYGARTHNVRLHKLSMLGVYVGGILIAGALTFLPGRIMHRVFFGG